ncbi:hypothetical protein JCM18882A_02030 [Brevibacterium metallidurans]
MRHRRRCVAEPLCRGGDGADLGEDPKDVEATIDHAIFLHDRWRKDSLLFAGGQADTEGERTLVAQAVRSQRPDGPGPDRTLAVASLTVASLTVA